MPGENITLYAEYTPANYHQITFNSNGGDLVNPIIEESGQDIQKPNNPYKEGYKFAGWYTDENFTELYSLTTMPDENITLYAKWVSNNEYVIEYNTNGGRNNSTNPTSYKKGKSIKIKDAVKDGAEFIGWYTKSGKIITNTNQLKGDTVLYAKWREGKSILVPDTASKISIISTIVGVVLIAGGGYIIYKKYNITR
jgi:uncharacterized repeat protein (TIGR02543 family)/LPXTG-motif cell wall-anchored protein